ncbi:MAG TPA: 50S ribosomal protein L10 [Terriglobales bacterium]|nr:50S ribosomal protein L10 [Terriglobales bacterium]
MAVTRAKKIQQAEVLGAEFGKAQTAILTSFTKLKASQAEELRKTVRGAGGRYRVVKNTLAERAGKGTPVEQALKGLKGVTSIAYTSQDPVALAKALSKYAKDNPEVTFKAVVLEGQVLPAKQIEALATMPSREEIMSKLLFLMNAPAQRLATVVNTLGRNLAVVINQGVKENKFAGGGGEAASA